jgi:hypothetical protein
MHMDVCMGNISLNKKQTENATIQEFILQVVEKEKPKDVEQLTNILQQKFPSPKHKIIEQILRLQNEGRITLKEPSSSIPLRLTEYLHSTRAYWYWTTVILTIATTILVFTVPEDTYPIVYARYLLGSIFVLFLPGYSFMRALFPTRVPIPTSKKELDNVERIALSIGMSFALVPIVGLLLNYTPWGIRLTPITISLSTLTLIFATAAIAREYKDQNK